MENQLEHITNILKECFDGKPWYGASVMEKLDAIPWEIVNEKIYGSKSIAVLVQHMINWRVFVLKKLKGDLEYDLKIDGPNDWSEVQIADEKGWEGLKFEIMLTQKTILEILSKHNDDLLDKKVAGKNYTLGHVLPSLAQHDIYHLGQIAMLYSTRKS